MYVGSKLYFFSVFLTVSWAVISMIFDSGIFVREIALWILGAGIFIGGMIGSATYIRIASNNETSKNNIPIDHIDSVEFSNRGLSSVAVVNYQMNGSGRSLLLQFPYSSPLEPNREVETAKIFSSKWAWKSVKNKTTPLFLGGVELAKRMGRSRP